MLGARQSKRLLQEQNGTAPRALSTLVWTQMWTQLHSTHRIFGLKLSNGGQDQDFFPRAILDSCCFGRIVSVPGHFELALQLSLGWILKRYIS